MSCKYSWVYWGFCKLKVNVFVIVSHMYSVIYVFVSWFSLFVQPFTNLKTFSLYSGTLLGAGEAEVSGTSVPPVLKVVQGSTVGQDSWCLHFFLHENTRSLLAYLRRWFSSVDNSHSGIRISCPFPVVGCLCRRMWLVYVLMCKW